MEYKELKSGISTHLNNAAEDFFMVGYFLRQISENALFVEDGYKSIWEFAKGEYGLSTSSASRFMAINARFSIDGGEHMAEKYIGMGVSKLQEMLGLPDEELEKVTQETTVKELRAMKAAKLSYYKLPVTVRPEGSLITTPGCGNGKHDCFSCPHPCNIRQESRLCMTSTLAEGRGCPHTSEDFLKDVEAGLYKDGCQFLHLELTEKRAGDGEAEPCCRKCEYKGLCYSSCDVAKKEYQKEQEQERRAREREAEQRRLEAEARKAEKEAAQMAADQKKRAAAKQAQLKAREDEFIQAFYENLYDSEKALVKERKRADITKLFKKEYGGRYEGSSSAAAGGPRWNCYPDKICFTLSGLGATLQITWSKFTTKLLQLLDTYPEIEKPKEPESAPEEKEPEIIDADFREVEDEPAQEAAEASEEQEDDEDLLCDDCRNASALTGNVDLCANCGPDGTSYEPLQIEDLEYYEPRDVWNLLTDYQKNLKAYREVGQKEGPIGSLLQKQRILTDALQLLYSGMTREEADDE